MNDPPFGIVAASVPDGMAVQLEFETPEQREIFKDQMFDLWVNDEYGEPRCFFNNQKVEDFLSKVLTKERGGPDDLPVLYLDLYNPFVVNDLLGELAESLHLCKKNEAFLTVIWEGKPEQIFIEYGRRESQKAINENLATIHYLSNFRRGGKS